MGHRSTHATAESALPALEHVQQALGAQRSRVSGFLADHQQRVRQIEESLASRLRQLLDELSAQQRDAEAAAAELAQQRAALQAQRERLAAQQSDLQRRGDELAATHRQQQVRDEELQQDAARLRLMRDELQQLQSAISDAQRLLHQQRADLETQRQSLDLRQEQLDALAAQLHEQHEQLQAQRQQFAQDACELADGRQRLQRQLSEVDQLRQQLQSQRDDLQAELDAARCAEADHAQQQRQLHELLARASEERDTALQQQRLLQREMDALRGRLANWESSQADAEQHPELLHLRARCAQLQQQVETLQNQLAAAQAQREEPSVSPTDAGYVLEDLQRRYDMVLQDLKQERKRTGELMAQLARLRAGSGQPSASASDGLDWEAQKRRLLQALENDLDEDDPDDAQQRRRIEDTIRRTEELVALKDREIEELQRLLQEQSSHLGEMAVGAAAVAEVLDRDEVIRQERENLARLQEEWREKLRGAEVEISLQRARLARERAELDEKLQQYQALLQKLGPNPETDTAKKQPTRGNWLTRLGLRSEDSS